MSITLTVTSASTQQTFQPLPADECQVVVKNLLNILKKYEHWNDSISSTIRTRVSELFELDESDPNWQQDALRRIDDLRKNILVKSPESHSFVTAMLNWANSLPFSSALLLPYRSMIAAIHQEMKTVTLMQELQETKTMAEEVTRWAGEFEKFLRNEIQLMKEEAEQKREKSVKDIQEIIQGINQTRKAEVDLLRSEVKGVKEELDHEKKQVQSMQNRSYAQDAIIANLTRQCHEMRDNQGSSCVIL